MSLATDLARAHDAHVRLSILRLLSDLPGYCANDSVLSQAVNAVGLTCTRDQVRGHLSWLAEQRLVTSVDAGHLTVATLTERGGDVAAGRSVVDGVQRPSPRS
jgi:hypothetical protein